MKQKNTLRAGFTLVEIMIVVSIMGLLAGMAVPNFVRARTKAQKNSCINNLRQIDSAIKTWVLEKGKSAEDTVDRSKETGILGYLKNAVACPAGGTDFDGSYGTDKVSTVPWCKCPGGGVAKDHTLTPN